MLVSIIIPVIRPDKAKRCIAAIEANAGIPRPKFEIIAEEDTERIGCPKMVAKLVAKAKGDMVCFLGDDTIPQPGFLNEALNAMAAFLDGWGLVGFNDNPDAARSCTHWLAHTKLLPHLDGEFFHTGYKHCFCDNELKTRAQALGRYIYAYNAILKHDHVAFEGGDALKQIQEKGDEDLKRAYSHYKEDMALYKSRLLSQWGKVKSPQQNKPTRVAIGVPSGDFIHADFALSLLNLCLVSLMRGVHSAVINHKSALVEAGRNEIIRQAIDMKADHVFFLDADMTFPSDTLLRLLSHGLDVVGCDASRRREPFTSVVKDLNNKPIDYTNCKPLEKLSGASSACQLIKMSVFDKLKSPYFRVEWVGENKFTGEDYVFSKALRDAGFKVWCDTKLSREIGHLGVKEFKIKA